MNSSSPAVQSFHHAATGTWTHVVFDREDGHAAIIDPVLDFDLSSGTTATTAAEEVLAFVQAQRLKVEWILETHVHADHLTAAAWLKQATGARVAIGRGITEVQARFKQLFGLDGAFATDGSQFDQLFADGDAFAIGTLEARVLATPGHTGDSLSYVIGDAAFVGDTLFAPEAGTARTDFPGGDAHALYRSIHALFALPAATRIFLCHDYPAAGHVAVAVLPLQDEIDRNIHVGRGVDEAAFVALRTARDATLAVPKLLLPSLQVNMRAGEFPLADANGIRYLRLPLDQMRPG